MRCLVATPHRYGIREVAERVGAEWEAMGHDVDYELARGSAARVGPVTVGVPGIAVWWYRQLRRFAAAADRYDLVWLHQPLAPVLPTAAPALWNRAVVTFHTTMRAEYGLARDGVYPARLVPFHWVNKTMESRFYRKLSAAPVEPTYTVVSPHLRDELAPLGVGAAAHVPNGISTPETAGIEPIRAEYGIPEGATLVFNVGKLLPQKRPETFARVMRGVTDRDESVYCVVAGKGPLRSAVAKYAGERLRVVGYVTDAEKWRWFADADVFASLSAYEGMPVASTEALSFGLPVVLSDIPAHRALFDGNGLTGELVEPEAEAVLSAIRRLAGRRAEVSMPGWREVAERYLETARAPPDNQLDGGIRAVGPTESS